MPTSAASHLFLSCRLTVPCAAFALLLAPACLSAQALQLDATNSVASTQPAPGDTSSPAPSAASWTSLPDAPSSSSSQPTNAISFDAAAAPAGAIPPAGRYDAVIAPGQVAPVLSVHDKFILGVKDSISPFSAVAWVINAGYEQATDGSPNYGYDGRSGGKVFVQRLGAAAARDVSQDFFSDSILAPILHEDPRYYRVGNRKNFIYRLFYAGTRPLITRTDGGRSTINLAQLGGNLAGSVLTQAYYPPPNTSFTESMKTFGGSVGGSALGDVVSEFFSGVFSSLHLVSSPQ